MSDLDDGVRAEIEAEVSRLLSQDPDRDIGLAYELAYEHVLGPDDDSFMADDADDYDAIFGDGDSAEGAT